MGHGADLADRADLDSRQFADLPDAPLHLRDASVLNCRFTDVRSQDVDLRGASVRETEVIRPDFTVTQAWRGRWSDVRVEAGRLGVLEAYDSAWNAVELVGCKLSFVNLRGSEVSDLTLRECQIEELDVSEGSIRRASLSGSHVKRLNFRGARMENVDLRGADYDEIAGVMSMRGTLLTESQLAELAPLMAEALGISVLS